MVLDSTVGNNIATTFKEVFFPRESNQKSFLTLMTTTTENVGKSLVVNNSPIQVLLCMYVCMYVCMYLTESESKS